jgi:gamma-glutamyltranspeptidase/glutathione hydrolase
MTSLRGAIVALLLLFGMAAPVNAANEGPVAEAANGMVVSVSRPASEVGVEMLRRGGNAVDAAIAVALALEVTWPEAGNIGGGGFMLIHPGPGKAPTLIDYREKAPAAAMADMFRDGKRVEARLVGVPGTVRGLELAHRRFGKLPWKELVLPAARLAEDGVVVNEPLARSLNNFLARRVATQESRRVYGKPGRQPWQPGDRLLQPDLARTLRRIAELGADAFYTGELAELLAAEMKRSGGLVTTDDLRAYQAKERAPVIGTYRDHTIYAVPPPSSGGTCLIEMLNLLRPFELRKESRWSPRTVHLMVEAMRRAYCDRARYLGDPDFVKIPRELITPEYAQKLAEKIDLSRATRSAYLGKDILTAGESEHTTHFSVIDREGMAVSNTYTLEESYGSGIVVKGAGYLLNDEMGDFNPHPGVTNAHGLIGTSANVVAPGKRMLSSMCPVIVTRNGRPVLLTGSPGGRTIINTVFCILVNALEYDLPLTEAVDAPRFHHQWMPDRLTLEKRVFAEHPALIDSLKQMGHVLNPSPTAQGDAHSIQWQETTRRYQGVSDRRRDGWAAGY